MVTQKMSNTLKSLTEKQIKNLIKNGKKGVFGLGIVEGLCSRICDKKVSYVLLNSTFFCCQMA